jgi:hypothetical protein
MGVLNLCHARPTPRLSRSPSHPAIMIGGKGAGKSGSPSPASIPSELWARSGRALLLPWRHCAAKDVLCLKSSNRCTRWRSVAWQRMQARWKRRAGARLHMVSRRGWFTRTARAMEVAQVVQKGSLDLLSLRRRKWLSKGWFTRHFFCL